MAPIPEKANFITFMEVCLPIAAAVMIDPGKTADQKLFACYYDALRYAIKAKKAGLLSASACNAIIANFKTYWRDTYLPSAGYAPAIPFYYTTGLAEDFLENGDTTSKSVIASLVANSGYTMVGADQSKFTDIHYAREVAFSLAAYINNFRVGNVGVIDARAATLKNASITLLQKWQAGIGELTQPYLRPFMGGLVCDTLILYDDVIGLTQSEKDEIRDFWTYVHTNLWRSGDTHPSLKFTSVVLSTMDPNVPDTDEQQGLVDQNQDPANQDGTGVDVSLMHISAYAWLYKQGYDGTTWIDRADEAFIHGFPHYQYDTGYAGEGDYYQLYGAYIGTVGPNGMNVKHLNQQLWTFSEFVDYREGLPLEPPEEPVEPGAPAGNVIIGGGYYGGGGVATYSISGTVTEGGSPLSGVLITASGGLSGTQTTGVDGTYSFTGVANGVSYTLTPSKSGYTFSPTTETGTVAGANITGENFVGTAASAYNPSDYVTGGTLRFNFDMSDASKVLNASSTPATSGQNVALINPVSGTPTLEMSVDGNRPTMITNVIGTKQGVRFPGTKFMDFTNARGLLNNQTKVLFGYVFKLLGTAAGNGQFFDCVDSGWNTSRLRLFLASAAPSIQGARIATQDVLNANVNLDIGTVNAVLTLWDVANATATMYINKAVVTNINGTTFSTAGNIEDADSNAGAPVRLGTSLHADVLHEFMHVGSLPNGTQVDAWFDAVKDHYELTVY